MEEAVSVTLEIKEKCILSTRLVKFNGICLRDRDTDYDKKL
jgi:hypothetical protein